MITVHRQRDAQYWGPKVRPKQFVVTTCGRLWMVGQSHYTIENRRNVYKITAMAYWERDEIWYKSRELLTSIIATGDDIKELQDFSLQVTEIRADIDKEIQRLDDSFTTSVYLLADKIIRD